VGDVGDLVQLRDDLARWLLSREIEQWRPGDLPKDWIEHEVEQGWVHIVRQNGQLVATVTASLKIRSFGMIGRNRPAMCTTYG
jgi:hypothetical protein